MQLSFQARNLEFLRASSPQERPHQKLFNEDILFGIMLFRFRNGRNIAEIFLISLLSSLMMIVNRSYKQKKALYPLEKKGRGQDRQSSSVVARLRFLRLKPRKCLKREFSLISLSSGVDLLVIKLF